jgi:alanine racemase
MNWIAVDVGPDSGVCRGDEVVLIGTQEKECVWANELASICRTIPYEIVVGIDASIKRQYLNP